MSLKNNDEYFMSLAVSEAKKGMGFTSPNPLVGAVIVKKNKIISTGYHKFFGGDHAEVDAINKCSRGMLDGSTLYVNLEPCCHQGKTPPCTDAVIKSGIKKVVISNIDPDLRVAGKGITTLRNAGITVKTGILEEEAKKLNSIYFFYRTENRPYIVLKSALTLDGRIAAGSGQSKWISSEKSRYMVHNLRLRLRSIAIGKNTVLKDNPRLDCRIRGSEEKPVDRLVFSTDKDQNLLNRFKCFPGRNFIIDRSISESCGTFNDFCINNEIDSVLVEGGSCVYTWFLENDLADRILLFYRASFMGSDGIPFYGRKGILDPAELQNFNVNRIENIDNDILIDLKKGDDTCSLEL